jgi:protein-tyrosine-phosphatase/DNA-binding transcriptional ArsR family regulator
MPNNRLRVLFLCTGNSARSQLAEALLRHHGGKRFEAFSAGTRSDGIDPRTLAALRGAGISIDGLTSKAIDSFTGQQFDFTIALCDKAFQQCPNWPGCGTVLDWGFSDPKADPSPNAFSRALFLIEERIRMFIEVNSRVRAQSTPLTAVNFYKCLADELRLRLLMMIEQAGELCVCDLTEALAVSQPKVSRHLAQLRKTGILSDRRQGQWVYYQLHPTLPDWMHDVIRNTLAANPELVPSAIANSKAV